MKGATEGGMLGHRGKQSNDLTKNSQHERTNQMQETNEHNPSKHNQHRITSTSKYHYIKQQSCPHMLLYVPKCMNI